ncbi:hypothetical protein ACOSP7_018722 [Xanthoceras sorbifolium]
MATLPLLSFHIIQAEVWSVAPETLPVTLFPPCNLWPSTRQSLCASTCLMPKRAFVCFPNVTETFCLLKMTLTDLLQLEKQLDATLTQTKARKGEYFPADSTTFCFSSLSRSTCICTNATADGVMTLHEKDIYGS